MSEGCGLNWITLKATDQHNFILKCGLLVMLSKPIIHRFRSHWHRDQGWISHEIITCQSSAWIVGICHFRICTQHPSPYKLILWIYFIDLCRMNELNLILIRLMQKYIQCYPYFLWTEVSEPVFRWSVLYRLLQVISVSKTCITWH